MTTNLLRAELQVALKNLRRELEVARHDPSFTTRDRAAYALTHVNEFLQILGWSDVSLPLIELNSALCDLDDGTIAPMLVAPTFQNRHKDTNTRNRFKGLCAASVVLLQRNCNMTVDIAAKHIATVVASAGFRIGGGDAEEGWKTIKSWRYDLTSHKRSPPPEALEQFNLLLSDPRWPAVDSGAQKALSFVRAGLLRAIAGIGAENIN